MEVIRTMEYQGKTYNGYDVGPCGGGYTCGDCSFGDDGGACTVANIEEIECPGVYWVEQKIRKEEPMFKKGDKLVCAKGNGPAYWIGEEFVFLRLSESHASSTCKVRRIGDGKILTVLTQNLKLKENEKMENNVEVGDLVEIQTGDPYHGNGVVGTVKAITKIHIEIESKSGEIFRPPSGSCRVIEKKKKKKKKKKEKLYNIDSGFTLQELLKKETCRDIHFRADFKILLDHVGNVFDQVETLPDHFYTCSTMKRKFIEFGFVSKIGKTYKAGDRFIYGDEYILANVAPNKFCLICLHSGNRWREAVKVKDRFIVTQDEFDLMGRGMFTFKEK